MGDLFCVFFLRTYFLLGRAKEKFCFPAAEPFVCVFFWQRSDKNVLLYKQ